MDAEQAEAYLQAQPPSQQPHAGSLRPTSTLEPQQPGAPLPTQACHLPSVTHTTAQQAATAPPQLPAAWPPPTDSHDGCWPASVAVDSSAHPAEPAGIDHTSIPADQAGPHSPDDLDSMLQGVHAPQLLLHDDGFGSPAVGLDDQLEQPLAGGGLTDRMVLSGAVQSDSARMQGCFTQPDSMLYSHDGPAQPSWVETNLGSIDKDESAPTHAGGSQAPPQPPHVPSDQQLSGGFAGSHSAVAHAMLEPVASQRQTAQVDGDSRQLHAGRHTDDGCDFLLHAADCGDHGLQQHDIAASADPEVVEGSTAVPSDWPLSQNLDAVQNAVSGHCEGQQGLSASTQPQQNTVLEGHVQTALTSVLQLPESSRPLSAGSMQQEPCQPSGETTGTKRGPVLVADSDGVNLAKRQRLGLSSFA